MRKFLLRMLIACIVIASCTDPLWFYILCLLCAVLYSNTTKMARQWGNTEQGRVV